MIDKKVAATRLSATDRAMLHDIEKTIDRCIDQMYEIGMRLKVYGLPVHLSQKVQNELVRAYQAGGWNLDFYTDPGDGLLHATIE